MHHVVASPFMLTDFVQSWHRKIGCKQWSRFSFVLGLGIVSYSFRLKVFKVLIEPESNYLMFYIALTLHKQHQ